MYIYPAEYAIRAMVFRAEQPSGKLTEAQEISQTGQIPGPFLWKILQKTTLADPAEVAWRRSLLVGAE